MNETTTETRASVRDLAGWPPNRQPSGSAEVTLCALHPEQGAPEYARPVHRRLCRSVTSDRLGRPRLSALDGMLPLPFRSRNRTPLRCAVCRPPGWGLEATATRFPTLLTSVHRWPPAFVNCADVLGVAASERTRTVVNETRFEPSDYGRGTRSAQDAGTVIGMGEGTFGPLPCQQGAPAQAACSGSSAQVSGL